MLELVVHTSTREYKNYNNQRANVTRIAQRAYANLNLGKSTRRLQNKRINPKLLQSYQHKHATRSKTELLRFPTHQSDQPAPKPFSGDQQVDLVRLPFTRGAFMIRVGLWAW